jgi:hypothetical protein
MFFILTEAVHLYSDKSFKPQTIRSVVEYSSVRLSEWEFDAEHFQSFIKTVPAKGTVQVHLRLETCINERLIAMKGRLEEICEITIPSRIAVAYFVQLCIDNNFY